MKRLILVFLCVFVLVGCDSDFSDKLTENEINLKYEQMRDKLVEYGKLLSEDDEWLKEYSGSAKSFVTLKGLAEKYQYDISMFVVPQTGEQCDLEQTGIEFIISDTSDVDIVNYIFNPLLVCGLVDDTISNDEIINNNYNDLSYKLLEYLKTIYDNDIWMNGGLEPSVYNVTLKEFEQMGYDVSMFINPVSGNKCDLEKTYGSFEIFGTTDEEKTDYTYSFTFVCE